jgi:hypothetical protein
MTEAHERTLIALLDALIPPRPDGALPGAGALGVDAVIVAAIEKTPELELTIAPGLAAAEALATERHGRLFAQLDANERVAVLRQLETSEPALLPTLTFHAYMGYYQDPRVIAALGMEPRPPHPLGYEMAPNDLSLLDPVRQRGSRFR